MKLFIVLCIILSVFAFSVDAGKKKRCGSLVTANCDTKTYQSCPAYKPICGYKQVLLQENSGCCCHGKCAANEIYGCACSDKVCNQPDKICIQCLNGCYCVEGYVRDVEGGKCIPENQCPIVDPQPPQCGENEVWGAGCAESLCNGPQFVRCQITEERCYCKTGYIRESSGGKCIPIEKCQVLPLPPSCDGPNESFYCKCADSVCNQPDIVCVRCEDGCHCNEGFVRDVEGGTCIPADKCPKLDKNCQGQNEVFDCRCVDEVCGMTYIPFAYLCTRCNEGCYCAEGYIRENIGGGQGGKCITHEECNASFI